MYVCVGEHGEECPSLVNSTQKRNLRDKYIQNCFCNIQPLEVLFSYAVKPMNLLCKNPHGEYLFIDFREVGREKHRYKKQ